MSERIDIKQISLTKEKCTESSYLFIELNDNHLVYAGEYWATEENEDSMLGKKDTYHKWHTKVKRESIVSTEQRWSAVNECYVIEIESSGKAENIFLFFKMDKEADVVNKKLDEYIFGKTN